MAKSYFASNLKFLRTAFGETQENLSLLLGLESKNTISNYEKGIRNKIDPKIRKKIAKHYGFTEEEFMSVDLRGVDPSFFEMDNERIHEMSMAAYPMAVSQEALMDDNFKKAYDIQKEIIESVRLGKMVINYQQKYYDLISLYSQSIEKNKTVESLINLLRFLLMNEALVNNEPMAERFKGHIGNKLSFTITAKQFLDDDVNDEFEDTIPFQDKIEFEELIDEMLNELKGYSEWRDLVDFYIPFRFMNNGIHNDLSKEMNRLIGRELLFVQFKMHNKYAVNYYKTLLKR